MTILKANHLYIFFIICLSLCPYPIGAGSRVQSTNTSPIGNLSDDVLLSCYLNTNNHQAVNDISVTWKKANLAGLVYKYQNGAPDLTDQNSQFKGRTLPFLDKLMTGNASLLLKGVRNSDRGEYTCSISYSEGTGEVNIYLRTAGKMTRLSSFTLFALKISHCDAVEHESHRVTLHESHSFSVFPKHAR